MIALAFVLLLGLLYWWLSDHVKDYNARVAQRQQECPHKPEWIETMRVNSLITMNPILVHALIPGKRWLKKRCRGCGMQWNMYSPSDQPWDKYKAEWDQETIDRNAEFNARLQHEINRREYERERARQQAGSARPGDD